MACFVFTLRSADENSINSPARRFWRTLGVLALSIYVLGLTIPNLLVTRSGGTLLQTTDVGYDYAVRNIVPGTPEALAGLRVGDKIDPPSLSVKGRLAFDPNGGSYWLRTGERLTFTVVRSGKAMPIAIRIPPSIPSSTLLTYIKRGSATLFVGIASALVLLRPRRMTWGFLLYAAGSVLGAPLFYGSLPSWAYVGLNESLNFIYAGSSIAGLWMFASRFPDDSSAGWRSTIDKAAIPTGLFFGVLGVAIDGVFVAGIPSSLPLFTIAAIGPNVFGPIVGFGCLLGGYTHLQAEQRQRLKWVVTGFALYFASVAYYNWISGLLPNGGWPASWSAGGWRVDVLNGVQIFIPITVAYAVLKHHVLDINFVVSKAVVYGALTTIIVGVFVVAEWVIGRVLDLQKLASVVNLGIAVAFGFSLNGMHKRVDDFVNRLIFRKRHQAEQRLERIAAGIAHATTSQGVRTALASEPAEAFGLTSAAIFRRTDDGDFRREGAVGWSDGNVASLHPDDPLVLHVQGERRPLRLRGIKREANSFPAGRSAPIIAIPVLVRHQLESIALYGPHVSGEDIDPDEVRMLERLSNAAAAAYDHIEAEALRHKVQELAALLQSQRAASTPLG